MKYNKHSFWYLKMLGGTAVNKNNKSAQEVGLTELDEWLKTCRILHYTTAERLYRKRLSG